MELTDEKAQHIQKRLDNFLSSLMQEYYDEGLLEKEVSFCLFSSAYKHLMQSSFPVVGCSEQVGKINCMIMAKTENDIPQDAKILRRKDDS